MKVLFVTTGLQVGGAEVILCQLIGKLKKLGIQCAVVSLISRAEMGRSLEAVGIEVRYLNMSGVPTIPSIVRLVRIIKDENPDIVQTWMYHGDLVGGIIGKWAAPRARIFWSVHNTGYHSGIKTLIVKYLCGLTSRFIPEKIICCSVETIKSHVKYGYSRRKMRYIPNGVNLEHFRADRKTRDIVRKELGLRETEKVIGVIARFDPQKDYGNLIRAAPLILTSYPQSVFVLCGRDVTEANPFFREHLEKFDLKSHFRLLGPRADISRLLSAFDLFCLPSLSEAFPVSLLEAMAAEVPCVVTDVGDCSKILNGLGWVVPRQNHVLLAEACLKALKLPETELQTIKTAIRQVVSSRYSLERMCGEFLSVYKSPSKEADSEQVDFIES